MLTFEQRKWRHDDHRYYSVSNTNGECILVKSGTEWYLETDYTTEKFSSSELRQIADKLDSLNSPTVGEHDKTTTCTDV